MVNLGLFCMSFHFFQVHLAKEEEKVGRGKEDVKSAGGFVVFKAFWDNFYMD